MTTALDEPRASDEVRLARAGLLRVCEPTAPGVQLLVERVGPVAAWEAVRHRRVVIGAGDGWLRETDSRTAGLGPAELVEQAGSDLAVAQRCGARLVVPEDGEWPEAALLGLADGAPVSNRPAAAPLALYVRGASLASLPFGGVTVVGARACTAYGRRVAAEIAYGAAVAGLTVVSGAAVGIDAAAHRGALGAGGELPTVAVLACGPDQSYPAENAGLVDRIAERGAVVTEYPPGTHPSRVRFLVRNRLIAALGMGTVVVEAGFRSGTLSTAIAAERLNRTLMVVPGPVVSAQSIGCHQLLKDDPTGRVLVTGAADVVQLLRPFRRDVPDADRSVGQSLSDDDDLGPQTKAVSDAMSTRHGRSVLEIAADAGLPSREVLDILSVLHHAGLAVPAGGGAWRRTARRSRP
jgi:DNA processing protein